MINSFVTVNTVTTFTGVRRQTKEGGIGNKLTGELARTFGLWWDKEFLKTISKLGFKMESYFRYVDDTEMVLRALDPGT